MDLKLKDVAELLNVSEMTVRRWLSDGKIPAYRLNRQYRFSRTEIEDWLMRQKLEALDEGEKEAAPEEEKRGAMQFSLYRAIYRGEVIGKLAGSTKESIIRSTMKWMGQRFDLDPAVLSDLFLDREKLASTGVGSGIAIPHTRDFLLSTHFDVVTIAYPEQPIDYEAIDGQPVHTLFFLFACEDRRHLHLLSKIAHLCSHEKTRAFFRTHPPKSRVLEYIKHWEGNLLST